MLERIAAIAPRMPGRERHNLACQLGREAVLPAPRATVDGRLGASGGGASWPVGGEHPDVPGDGPAGARRADPGAREIRVALTAVSADQLAERARRAAGLVGVVRGGALVSEAGVHALLRGGRPGRAGIPRLGGRQRHRHAEGRGRHPGPVAERAAVAGRTRRSGRCRGRPRPGRAGRPGMGRQPVRGGSRAAGRPAGRGAPGPGGPARGNGEVDRRRGGGAGAESRRAAWSSRRTKARDRTCWPARRRACGSWPGRLRPDSASAWWKQRTRCTPPRWHRALPRGAACWPGSGSGRPGGGWCLRLRRAS